ncbi:MAG: hypothetical protein KAS32_05605 [Candidatus Peribacteraceae bacterium]|nr:hypothetical protein [Candidatus Peribacteraceae bacterium]
MAYSSTDLDNIDSAISSGELEVTYGDKRVKYRSIAELRTARAIVAAAVSGNRPQRQMRVGVSKGLT